MIREIGSMYNKVEFVKDRVYVTIDGTDYVVENEWVKVTYKVTKKGDVVVKVVLATEQEIAHEKKIQGIIELDKEIQEEWNELKHNVKNTFNKLKEKFNNKFNK